MVLLLILAALSGCSVIGTLAIYVLIARFALVQRVAAVVLRRGLRGLSEGGLDGQAARHTVSRTDTGKHAACVATDVHLNAISVRADLCWAASERVLGPI